MSRFLHLSKKWGFLVLTIAMVLTMAPQSKAALLAGSVLIAPGTAGFPGLVPPGTPAGTELASLTSPYSFTTTAGTTSGTLTSAVYRNPSGTLDFYYQVANSATSATAIARESNTNFAGWQTALGFRIDGSILGGSFVNGTVAPTQGDVTLMGPGNTVGFQFGPPDTSKILPGMASTVFVISTNATSYMRGNAEIIDGGTQTVAAFQPVPEPATMALLGAGLLALASFRRFRK